MNENKKLKTKRQLEKGENEKTVNEVKNGEKEKTLQPQRQMDYRTNHRWS